MKLTWPALTLSALLLTCETAMMSAVPAEAASSYTDHRQVYGFTPMHGTTLAFHDYLLSVTSFLYDAPLLKHQISVFTQGHGSFSFNHSQIQFNYEGVSFTFVPYQIRWVRAGKTASAVAWIFRVETKAPHVISQNIFNQLVGATPWYIKNKIDPAASAIAILNLALFRGVIANFRLQPYPADVGGIMVEAYNRKGMDLEMFSSTRAGVAGLWALDNRIINHNGQEPSLSAVAPWIATALPGSTKIK